MAMAVKSLAGKVALVSGASRGVGRVYALALAEAGAQVVATARSLTGDPKTPGTLAELVATAREAGGQVTALACDLESEANIVHTVQTTIANFGGVDILVNNAVWPARGIKTLAVSEEEWAATMKVNVRGPYAFMREVIPSMTARGGGSIINLTTRSAHVTKLGAGSHDGLLIYGVSKAALERLTTFFAAQFEPRNIAVNAISPGHVTTYSERSGKEPDLRYWGDPIVHLAGVRPNGGFTGKILHTYRYGREWGPVPETPPQWDEHILGILRQFDGDE
jgi:citronellol/citronellal dehydrogenase